MSSTLDIRKLSRLLGMLGSDHDGEVLNAARMAHRLIKESGVGWEAIVNGSALTGLGGANRAAGGREGQGSYQEGYDAACKLAKDAFAAEYDRGFNDGVNSARMAKRDRSWKLWAADRLKEDEDCLSDWEIKFFGDFSGGRFATPTVKQRAVFEKVAARLGIEHPGQNAPPDELPF